MINQDYTAPSIVIFCGLILLLCLAFMFDIAIGPAKLDVLRVIAALFQDAPATDRVIVVELRLPIALTALGVGGCLGLAGAAMQTVLDNPLASPFTMGLAAAAGVGASLVVALGGGALAGFANGAFALPLGALAATLLAGSVIAALGRWQGMSREVMVLCGIAIMFLCQSIQAMVQFSVSPEALTRIVHWNFGDLQKGTWLSAAIAGLTLVVGLAMLMPKAWALTALRLGEVRAQALGVNVIGLRRHVLIIVAFLTAAAVCFVGTVGFVGLVAPHLARGLVGEDHRLLLPTSALTGAIMVSGASLLAKCLVPGVALPITVVTALVGVPFLFLLIYRSGRRGQC